jgi:hypothetical protein
MPPSVMNDWLLRAAGYRLPTTSASALPGLQAELAEAKAAGDAERVADVAGRMEELVDEVRQAKLDESRATREAFSSGVRTPIRRRPSPNEQMDELFLRATGREPAGRRLR